MSLCSWLTGSPASPPARVEPAIAAGLPAVATKQSGDIVGSINSMAFPQPLLCAALGGYASNTGVPVTPFTALQSAAVYACTKCISEDIACLPVQIRRKQAGGGWVIDERHPLNLLFRRPNRLVTAFQFWTYYLTAYCLRGKPSFRRELRSTMRPPSVGGGSLRLAPEPHVSITGGHSRTAKSVAGGVETAAKRALVDVAFAGIRSNRCMVLDRRLNFSPDR
jgi:hypothetical protein